MPCCQYSKNTLISPQNYLQYRGSLNLFASAKIGNWKSQELKNMKNDIKVKLQEILVKDGLEETDVVYILSRIRKLLEVDGNKRDFKILNFYCNWALHSVINDTDSVSEILSEPDKAAVSLMHLYQDFDEELKRFLSIHNLTTKIFSDRGNQVKFHHLLSEIYSDTPLIVKTTSRKRFTFTKIESLGENSGFFSTTIEEI
jgi:hypothetical protein